MKTFTMILFATLAIAGCSSASEESTGDTSAPSADKSEGVAVQAIDDCIEAAGDCVAADKCTPENVIPGIKQCARIGKVCCQ